MILTRVRALALACLLACAPALAISQTQPAPTARQGTSTIPRDTTPSSIFVAPAGGGYGPGTVVAADVGLPVNCISGCSGGGGGASDPFAPTGNATLSVTTSSARVALGSSDDTTVVQNLGSATAYVNFGNSAVTAATTNTPVAPGMAIAFDANTATHIAAITSSGSTNLAVTTGVGVPTFGLALDNSTAVPITDNGSTLSVDDGGGSLTIDGTVAATQSGTWNITNVSGTVSLPTGAATAAKQPALGTAGTPAADVLSIQGLNNMTPIQIGGGSASGAAISGNPIRTGCAINGSLPTEASGDIIDVQCTTRGVVIVEPRNASGNAFSSTTPTDGGGMPSGPLTTGSFTQVYNGTTWNFARGDAVGVAVQPYGMRSARWSYAAASGGILNTTTAVTIKAAAGAATKNCLVSLDYMAETLGTATELAVRDGAGGTVIWRTKVGTAGAPGANRIEFSSPICGTDNTLMEVVTLTASGTGAIYFNANGYVGP